MQVWVSRKGAIQADASRPGLIRGSMGTASYVVEGLGCIQFRDTADFIDEIPQAYNPPRESA